MFTCRESLELLIIEESSKDWGDEAVGDRECLLLGTRQGTARLGSTRGKGSGSPPVLAPPPSPASGGQLHSSSVLQEFLVSEEGCLWGGWDSTEVGGLSQRVRPALVLTTTGSGVLGGALPAASSFKTTE